MYSSYERIRAFGVATPPVFPCYNDVFVNGTKAQNKVVARIEKMFSVFFGVFVRSVSVGLVQRLSRNRLI